MEQEQDPIALGQDVQVIDPDVRGHVYSLVTAVNLLPRLSHYTRTHATVLSSLEVSMAKMRTATSWVMTPWHACAISSGG